MTPQTTRPSWPIQWNPMLDALQISGIREMFSMASGMRDVIHLSVGQPDFPTPPHIIEAYIAALRDGRTKYGDDEGLPELREALAAFYGAHYGRTLAPENFIVTNGAAEALHLTIVGLCRPGGEVVVIEPSFVLYQPMIRMAGAVPKRIITTADRGFQVDPREVIDALNDRTCAVILNSPSNPTGTVYPPATVEAIVRETARRGIPLISDEVYEHLTFTDEPFSSALRCAPSLDHVFIANSVSKTYSMPGVRIGWVCSSAANIQVVRRHHMHTTTCGNTPGQLAAAAALRGDQRCVRDMAGQYRQRRDRVVELVQKIPPLQGYCPQGAFYIMPALPAGTDGVQVAQRMLRDTGVCTVPGASFGQSCANALRLSYATAPDRIEQAFARMTAWFATQSF